MGLPGKGPPCALIPMDMLLQQRSCQNEHYKLRNIVKRRCCCAHFVQLSQHYYVVLVGIAWSYYIMAVQGLVYVLREATFKHCLALSAHQSKRSCFENQPTWSVAWLSDNAAVQDLVCTVCLMPDERLWWRACDSSCMFLCNNPRSLVRTKLPG